MTIETIEKDVVETTEQLIEMSKDICWNTISNNCTYIITEIDNSLRGNTVKGRETIKKNDQKKKDKPLSQIVLELQAIYPNLYDVVLTMYRALPNKSIIEIRYYPKSAFDKAYFDKIKDKIPLIHPSILIPPYINSLNPEMKKFDINWQHGGLRHKWNIFWAKSAPS